MTTILKNPPKKTHNQSSTHQCNCGECIVNSYIERAQHEKKRGPSIFELLFNFRKEVQILKKQIEKLSQLSSLNGSQSNPKTK